MKKTILFIPGFVCDTWCTIENYTVELTKVLQEDFNIIWLVPNIINPDNKFKNEESRSNLSEPVYAIEAKRHNIKLVRADLSKKNIIKNLLTLNKIFKQYNIDAVYTEFGFERYMATICSKLLGKKTIFRAHGSMGGNHKIIKYVIHSLFMDVFLAVSYYVSTFIPKFKKQYIIQNAIDVKKEQDLSEQELFQLKKELGLEKFENIVIMIAKFDKGKRYDVALDIVEKVRNNTNKNIGFVFLGAGDLYDYYQQEIKNRNLQDVVYAPGYTTEVEKYLQISDVSILTSLEEGLPCCFLESLNYGLPLIAFNRNWAHELIKNGTNGYLIDIDDINQYANTILELVNNEVKRKEFSKNSRKIICENFNMDLWRQKMKKTFNEILR